MDPLFLSLVTGHIIGIAGWRWGRDFETNDHGIPVGKHSVPRNSVRNSGVVVIVRFVVKYDFNVI